MTVGRRAGIVTFVVLLAGGSLLASLPFRVGAIRLGGVGLVWWFGLVLVPLAVAAVVVGRRLGGEAAPTPAAALLATPVVVATIVAHVFAGSHAGPLLVAASALPLLLVAEGSPAVASSDVTATIARLVTAGLLLWSNVLIAADVARLAGGRRWHGLAAAGAIAVVAALGPAVQRRRGPILAVGALLLVAGLVAVGALSGTPPWSAWRTVASRSTLAFGNGSAWVVDGGTVLDPSVLTFGEPHRVTAQTPVTLRVVESDGDRATVREWRLGAGESVMLRPGDRLAVPPGARLKFEPGQRVPGAPASGVTWADPPPALGDVVGFLGAALTLAGGVLALALRVDATAGGGATAPPLIALTTAVAAAGWGLYGAFVGADLALGAPGFAPLVRLPSALGHPGMVVIVLLALAGLALWAALLALLREWAIDSDAGGLLGGDDVRRTVWLALVAGATVVAWWPADAWRAFALGTGFAGATLAVPALAGGPPAVQRAAASAGALVFAALALAGGALGGGAPALLRYPAPVAMAVGWGVAWVAAGQRD